MFYEFQLLLLTWKNTISYKEVALSQLIQIHENLKYRDSITLEFRRPNSDSVTEVITPQSGAQSLQDEAIYSATG